jgi:organic hydroperoxide reductase OsmC/OhrA
VIELIWDRGRSGTATAPTGASITVGEASDFSPDDLIAAAAAGCLMRTFLARASAAGVPVLSYASASHVETSGGVKTPQVMIRCYVVTTDSTSAPGVDELLLESLRESGVCQLLGDAVTCQADIRRLCGVCAE